MGDITWVLRYFICRLLCCFAQKLIQSNNKETIKLCIKLVDSLYKGLVIWKVYRYHDTVFLRLFMSIIPSCWCSLFIYRETETCLKRQSPGYLFHYLPALFFAKSLFRSPAVKDHLCRVPTLMCGHFIQGLCTVMSHSIVQFTFLNSLRPSDAIWRHRSGSTLAQVMACCLTAPSHYLNQGWLTISKV